MEYAGKNVKIRKQELTKNIQKKKYRTLGKAENSEDEILISVMEQQNFCQRPENGSGINGVQE